MGQKYFYARAQGDGMPWNLAFKLLYALLPQDWEASTSYSIGDVRRPTDTYRRRAVCVTAGTSGASEPIWDMIVGNTTNDGTVVWQMEKWRKPRIDHVGNQTILEFDPPMTSEEETIVNAIMADYEHAFDELQDTCSSGKTVIVVKDIWSVLPKLEKQWGLKIIGFSYMKSSPEMEEFDLIKIHFNLGLTNAQKKDVSDAYAGLISVECN